MSRLAWNLLRFDWVEIGHKRWLKITHMPTQESVKGYTNQESRKQLKNRILPELEEKLKDWEPEEWGQSRGEDPPD